MRTSWITEDEIIAALVEQERGLKTAEVCCKHLELCGYGQRKAR